MTPSKSTKTKPATKKAVKKKAVRKAVKKKTPARNLSAKQELFVAEYLKDLNATQAAIRAGYSKKTAKDIACENLAKPNIKAAIAEGKKKRIDRVQVDADWVLKRLFEEAGADLADLYNKDGSVKPVHDWPMIWRQGLVANIETTVFEGITTYKVKLADRAKTMKMLGDHVDVAAFQKNINHSGSLDTSNQTKEEILDDIKGLLNGGV